MFKESTLFNILQKLPEGYTAVVYEDNTYGLTKTTFNNGKSLKVYAKELGGNNFISLNHYMVSNKELLKPCEMPEEKVVHFLRNMVWLPIAQK